jgi:hypothetical protein
LLDQARRLKADCFDEIGDCHLRARTGEGQRARAPDPVTNATLPANSLVVLLATVMCSPAIGLAVRLRDGQPERKLIRRRVGDPAKVPFELAALPIGRELPGWNAVTPVAFTEPHRASLPLERSSQPSEISVTRHSHSRYSD